MCYYINVVKSQEIYWQAWVVSSYTTTRGHTWHTMAFRWKGRSKHWLPFHFVVIWWRILRGFKRKSRLCKACSAVCNILALILQHWQPNLEKYHCYKNGTMNLPKTKDPNTGYLQTHYNILEEKNKSMEERSTFSEHNEISSLCSFGNFPGVRSIKTDVSELNSVPSSWAIIPDRPGRWDRQWVPKRRLLYFGRRGNSQKNTDYILNTAKV